jgi:hypothetical protein
MADGEGDMPIYDVLVYRDLKANSQQEAAREVPNES